MPQAARLGDPIAHSYAEAGLLIGAVLGAALAAAFVIGTGGAGALAIAAAASTGVGLGGAVGEFAGLFGTTITGVITSGATRVDTNLPPAARATDFVTCAWHGQQKIAQGSRIVGIEGWPAARVGDMTTCSAVIAKGSGNVNIGGPTATVLTISPEVPLIEEAIVGVLGLLGGVGEIALASAGARGILAARLASGLAFGFGAGALGGRIGAGLYGDGSIGERKMALGAGLLEHDPSIQTRRLLPDGGLI